MDQSSTYYFITLIDTQTLKSPQYDFRWSTFSLLVLTVTQSFWKPWLTIHQSTSTSLFIWWYSTPIESSFFVLTTITQPWPPHILFSVHPEWSGDAGYVDVLVAILGDHLQFPDMLGIGKIIDCSVITAGCCFKDKLLLHIVM